jgi:hypothetical protein
MFSSSQSGRSRVLECGCGHVLWLNLYRCSTGGAEIGFGITQFVILEDAAPFVALQTEGPFRCLLASMRSRWT